MVILKGLTDRDLALGYLILRSSSATAKTDVKLMPKTLATATVDRLRYHAHVCQTSGDSVRLTQALAGQG